MLLKKFASVAAGSFVALGLMVADASHNEAEARCRGLQALFGCRVKPADPKPTYLPRPNSAPSFRVAPDADEQEPQRQGQSRPGFIPIPNSKEAERIRKMLDDVGIDPNSKIPFAEPSMR